MSPVVIQTAVQVLFGFLGTIGFGILFSVPRRALFLTGLVGALGALVRAILLNVGASTELADYGAALVVGLAGYGAAFVIESPRIVYTVPGVLPMIPGVLAYQVVVYFSTARYTDGLTAAIQVFLITGALAAGLVTARTLTELRPRRPAEMPMMDE
jgi:uncharacterized membrane protein YjjB (DUF3815 family)